MPVRSYIVPGNSKGGTVHNFGMVPAPVNGKYSP